MCVQFGNYWQWQGICPIYELIERTSVLEKKYKRIWLSVHDQRRNRYQILKVAIEQANAQNQHRTAAFDTKLFRLSSSPFQFVCPKSNLNFFFYIFCLFHLIFKLIFVFTLLIGDIFVSCKVLFTFCEAFICLHQFNFFRTRSERNRIDYFFLCFFSIPENVNIYWIVFIVHSCLISITIHNFLFVSNESTNKCPTSDASQFIQCQNKIRVMNFSV